MSVRYKRATPLLIVDRVEPTRDFFVDRLGFVVQTEIPHESTLGFVIVERDDVEIMIQSHASVVADVGHDASHLINDAISGRGAATVHLHVEDVEQIVPAIADTPVIVPLRKTWYGSNEIMVQEPGGHAIMFASIAGTAPSLGS